MKNLFYKEIKLSIHWLCYVLIVLLSTEALAPGIPAGIHLVYLPVNYTMLFIGVNKATSTNDLLYSLTLPIKKRDVIKARLISIGFLQIIYFALIFAFLLLTELKFVPEMLANDPKSLETMIEGIGARQGIAFLGVSLATFAFSDVAYFLIYYRTGKSIVAASIVAPLVVLACAIVFDVLPAILLGNEIFTIGSASANYLIQVAFLVVGLGLYIGSRFLITNKCAKSLEKLDF